MDRQLISQYDVIVIGAGPAGCAAALTLLTYSKLTVILVERAPNIQKLGETVPPSILSLLEYLQVDQQFLASNHKPVHGLTSAWGQRELFERSFLFGLESHGWHLDRLAFEQSLRQQVENRGGRCRIATIRTTETSDKSWIVRTVSDRGEESITARFLIDASGRSARFARSAGAQRLMTDELVAAYRLCQLQPARDTVSGGGALIESVEQGWWYSAVLPSNALAVAYFTDADLLRADHAHRSSGWNQKLRQTMHTQVRLQGADQNSKIQVNQAASHRLSPSHGKNWVAAGDAALAVDPLSSMGIGLALLTGIHAARVAIAACRGQDVSACGYSKEIERQFQEYLVQRDHYYQQETRWRANRFWQRRLGQNGH